MRGQQEVSILQMGNVLRKWKANYTNIKANI